MSSRRLDIDGARLSAIVRQRDPACTISLRAVRPETGSFAAWLEMNSGEICIEYDPRWRWWRHRALRRYCRRHHIKDPIGRVVDFLAHHELEHRASVPGSPEMGDRLHEQVWLSLALHGKGAYAALVANLLADLLVNVNTMEHNAPAHGLLMAWYDQGMYPLNLRQRLRMLAGRPAHRYDPPFSVHVAAHLKLLHESQPGDDEGSELLLPFVEPDAEIEVAAQRLAALVTAESLRNPQMWPALFRNGAAILEPFLPRTQRSRRGRSSSSSHRGRSVDGRAQQKPDHEPRQKGGKQPAPPHAPGQHPWLQPRDPYEARRRGSGTWFDSESGRLVAVSGGGSGPDIDAIDHYYNKAARVLPLSLSVQRAASADYAELSNFTLVDRAQATAQDAAVRLVLFAVDTSGSMFGGAGGPPYLPWSVTSAYHNAIMVLYRLAKWAEANNKIEGLNVVLFSNTTRSTGWFPPAEFRHAATALFCLPEKGNTTLDPAVLEQQIAGAGGGVLLFILSDACLDNSTPVLEALQRLRARCLPILVLCNNAANDFSMGMERAGFPVHAGVKMHELETLLLEDIAQNLPGVP
jgi:hypothetical protein